ncbi:hypothetical protein [Aquimarina intermedia]|nr:hypothetical protein [Aquimarina intermedia]
MSNLNDVIQIKYDGLPQGTKTKFIKRISEDLELGARYILNTWFTTFKTVPIKHQTYVDQEIDKYIKELNQEEKI